MAEHLQLTKGLSRAERYVELIPQIRSLVLGETDVIANLANLSAVLKAAFDFFWVGFYLVKGQELVLGPFQGSVACTRIQKGKGVCGAAWKEKRVILVPDVDRFPGHIACSSLSKSEIVVPVIVDGDVRMILDVDSDILNDFSEIDEKYLKQIVKIIAEEII
ncbi:MAG: GAF domain-containing protein [Cytophagales bacterium]|nr:GAF domain-containing protein [Cytophagales bacterium]